MAKRHFNKAKRNRTTTAFQAKVEECSVPEGEQVVRTSIRFKNQELTKLRACLLADLSNEYFGVLLAKEHRIGNVRILTVLDAAFPSAEAYKQQAGAALRVGFDAFMKGVLQDVDSRVDVDTIIDVHTHPFAQDSAWFSSIDDADERSFAKYLSNYGIHYASIVLTRTAYKARYWGYDKHGHVWHTPALIKTQKLSENISSPDVVANQGEVDEMFDRSVRALGLSAMRQITSGQTITVVGVGGLGSVAAEHLVHMGFSRLNLVDFDKLEITNMNRIVGATYDDAQAGVLKVEAVKKHLLSINPRAHITCLPYSVSDSRVEEVLAESDWVMVATDNHASRFYVQKLCFQYFVPFITAGVNITVNEGKVLDMSGEVILVRMGDRVCLSCLNRVNYNEVAKELHPDPAVREGLVAKGYVRGANVHEPAVKTLNTMLATMAVDTLINQYTERQRDIPVLVYENNLYPTMYEDVASVSDREKNCVVCSL